MSDVCRCLNFIFYIENQIKLILVIQYPSIVNTIGKAKCKLTLS